MALARTLNAALTAFAALSLPVPLMAQQPAPAPTAYGDAVTLEQARRIADAGLAAARARGFTMAFAIVDPGGNLILFHRMDQTQIGSTDVALEKARTSALFRRSTKAFFDALAGGRTAVLRVPNVIAIEGGVPIVAGGKVIGGLGVSGGSAVEDGEIAAAALATALAGN